MEKLKYIADFEKLGMGMFVHFGLYSVAGKGEWYQHVHGVDGAEYMSLAKRFKVKKSWARELVATARSAGCRYITITTRHHDGFSLYDTLGLNDYDAPHSAAGRDLIREFVDECNRCGIVPFFYHTLLDWYNPDYKNDFPKYLEYLRRSVEILCTRYGKIGGLWFDGAWDKPDGDWEEDALYAVIRRHQPEAMIINNTGLSAHGKTGHREIDSVTFERGRPTFVDCTDKYVAGEMCQVLNDHWGYARCDVNYKSVGSLVDDLVQCRRFNCNFLINIGPMGNGSVRPIDKAILSEIGKWVRLNKGVIYNVHSCDVDAEGAVCMTDGEYIYAFVRDVGMSADPNVTIGGNKKTVKILSDKRVVSARWLDNGGRIVIDGGNSFAVEPYFYGTSLNYRIARFKLGK